MGLAELLSRAFVFSDDFVYLPVGKQQATKLILEQMISRNWAERKVGGV
jgi:hypothetical protein